MNLLLHRNPARGLAALRKLSEARPPAERCELCGVTVREGHQHLVDPGQRRLLCACDACAILFDQAGATHFRRVPRDVREPAGLAIDDALWSRIGIPIGLVFFFRSSVSKGVLAVYPSPGGPTESGVEEDIWSELAALHSAVGVMPDDVEALLVNRIKGASDYYLVPIDECYRLSGLIRRHWTGFSGGERLWEQVGRFFDGLRQRALPERNAGHA